MDADNPDICTVLDAVQKKLPLAAIDYKWDHMADVAARLTLSAFAKGHPSGRKRSETITSGLTNGTLETLARLIASRLKRDFCHEYPKSEIELSDNKRISSLLDEISSYIQMEFDTEIRRAAVCPLPPPDNKKIENFSKEMISKINEKLNAERLKLAPPVKGRGDADKGVRR